MGGFALLLGEGEYQAFFGRKMQHCVFSFSFRTFLFLCLANKEKEKYSKIENKMYALLLG